MITTPVIAGLSFQHPDAVLGLWTPGTPIDSVDLVSFGPVVNPAIRIEPSTGPLLPVTLRSTLSFCDQQAEGIERMFHAACDVRNGRTGTSDGACALVVPARATAAFADLCRAIGRKNGWNRVLVVNQDVAAIRYGLRDESSTATVLTCCLEYDGVELSLASVLKGIVRIRDRMALRCLSQAGLDELILAHAASLSPEPVSPADPWPVRWCDARQIRQQLNESRAAFAQVAPPAWPRAQAVELSRDDLYPSLAMDVETVLDAAAHLLERNRIPASGLGRILLVGDSPLLWPESRRAFSQRFGTRVDQLPPYLLAVGACLYGSAPDEDSAARVASGPAGEAWSARTPAVRAATVQSLAGPESSPSASGPVPPPAISADASDLKSAVHRNLSELLSGLRLLSNARPEAAVRLARQIQDDIGELIDDLAPTTETPVAEVPVAAPPHPDLVRADEFLAAGRLDEAVRWSHQAQASAPNDPAVFRHMVDLHVRAANASADSQTALQWLQCAHSHDKSDKRIHRLLAECLRRRAAELESRGDWFQALSSVQESLVYEPSSGEALVQRTRLRERIGSGPARPT